MVLMHPRNPQAHTSLVVLDCCSACTPYNAMPYLFIYIQVIPTAPCCASKLCYESRLFAELLCKSNRLWLGSPILRLSASKFRSARRPCSLQHCESNILALSLTGTSRKISHTLHGSLAFSPHPPLSIAHKMGYLLCCVKSNP